MTDGALLVPERRASLTVQALGMASDGQEIPELPDSSKPVGWWLAERSTYRGPAATAAENQQLAGIQDTACDGTTALAVTKERVLGIVSPNDETTPAVWWSWSLSGLDIQTAGEQGFLRKRPVSIALMRDGATVELSAVSRLWRNSGRYQDGQEGSLVKALGQ